MRTTGYWTLLAVLGCVAVAQAKPNFTGEWKVNVGKSDFGLMPPPTSMTQKITHNDPQLKVATAVVTESGDFSNTSSYTTDGKECVNQMFNTDVKSTVKWDGDTLTIDSRMDFQGDAVKFTEMWSLSEDGKTLTKTAHFSGPQGEGDSKTIFEKQ
jgi:hypothetical protein